MKKGANYLSRAKCGLLLLAFALVPLLSQPSMAEENATIKLSDALNNLQIGILAFIDYSAGSTGAPMEKWTRYNRFSITRGYLTVSKDFTPWFAVRMTTDVHQAADGSTDVRFKFIYGQFKFPKLLIFTDNKSEIGMAHNMWHEFDESIDMYRCQGTMPIERAGIFPSADIGVDVMGYFGGKLQDGKKRTGTDKFDGKYGSWGIGVYNGGGYAAVENNQNKIVEGRVSLRPLPGIAPWVQLTWFGLVGQGNAKFTTKITTGTGKNMVTLHNTPYNRFPLFNTQIGMLSFQHPWVFFSGQYFIANGNAAGTLIDARGYPLQTTGYSFFGNVKIPVLGGKPAVFARYDFVNSDTTHRMSHKVWDVQSLKWYNDSGSIYRQYIAGVAYSFYKENMIIADYQYIDYGRDSGGQGKVPVLKNDLESEHRYQVVLQIKF